MVRFFSLIAILSLCGCAVWSPDDAVKSFVPYAMNISDPAVYEKDRETCVAVALAYPHSLDVQGVVIAAGQGAADNAASAAIDPLILAAGAAGGATSETLSGLGLSTKDEKAVMVRCMDKLSERDHAFDVVDPN